MKKKPLDTAGILEPGEVFFKSSKRQFKTPEGMETDIFVGDVLVTRHPCKLPTDIQKVRTMNQSSRCVLNYQQWKSIDKPGLYHLTDLIVFSTKGARRAADLLSGGAYILLLIWLF
jgi:RNA-dependent RNA polymerase